MTFPITEVVFRQQCEGVHGASRTEIARVLAGTAAGIGVTGTASGAGQRKTQLANSPIYTAMCMRKNAAVSVAKSVLSTLPS